MSQRLTLSSFGSCLWKGMINTVQHDGIEQAGYLAFLGLLALFPFLVFVVATLGFLGQGAVGAAFITNTLALLPERITEALQPRVYEIVSGPPPGLLTLSILGAIWTASSAVEGLRTVLNRAYHVGTPPAYWFRRSLSILQLLVFTFILISGMLVLIALPFALTILETHMGFHFSLADQEYWSRMVFFMSIGLLYVAVCAIYYVLPNIKQSLISVMPGAAFVVVLWILAANLLTFYVSQFPQVSLIYGSLGGLIAALIFFYLCNVIFIFGAEFNYQLVKLLGQHLEQREAAPPDPMAPPENY